MHEKLLSSIMQRSTISLNAEYPAIAADLGCSVSALRQHLNGLKQRPLNSAANGAEPIKKRASPPKAKNSNGGTPADKGDISGNGEDMAGDEGGRDAVTKSVKKEESGADNKEDGMKPPHSKKRKMVKSE